MDTLSLTKEARIYNGEKTISLTSGAGKTDQPLIKRKKLEHFLTPYTKINSKWIKGLNVTPETIKLLEENISKTLSDINHSRILYDPPPRVMEIKAKINKWDLIKLKNFCTMKETIIKVERQPSEWQKIIANKATDQELIYKQLMQLSTGKINEPIKKIGQRTKQTFLQRRHTIQMAKNHMKRCSTSLIIREMQIKTTKRYHLMPFRIAAIKKSTKNKCWRGYRERNPLTLLVGMQTSTATMGNSVEIP